MLASIFPAVTPEEVEKPQHFTLKSEHIGGEQRERERERANTQLTCPTSIHLFL